jgi:chromatin licensing and DNA replication factor 1
MSQAKVTEFFATRKRTRHGANDDLLVKQVKSVDAAAAMPPTSEKQTRSRTKKQEIDEAKKEQLALVKSRITRLDAKLAKVTTPEPSVQQAPAGEAAAKGPAKMRLNKAELKQKIEQFNKNLLQVQSEKAEEEKAVAAAPSVKETTTAPTQPLEARKKDAVAEEIPAFLKFKDLASSELDIATTLTLPKSYSLLLDSFKGSDTIVKFLFNRDELCTFLKLKMGIQNITKHTFALKHLAQIKTVYPQAYTCKQEKLFVDFKNDYHLIISPNLEGRTLFIFIDSLSFFY